MSVAAPEALSPLFEQEINNEENRKFNPDNFAYGMWLFVTGLAKKVLLADVFSKAVSWGIGYSIDHMTAMDAILVILSFIENGEKLKVPCTTDGSIKNTSLGELMAL